MERRAVVLLLNVFIVCPRILCLIFRMAASSLCFPCFVPGAGAGAGSPAGPV